MTLKMTILGAVLAVGLFGAVGQAKAEMVRVDEAPAAHVVRVRHTPRARWGRQDRRRRELRHQLRREREGRVSYER
jgi:hypothetical protein